MSALAKEPVPNPVRAARKPRTKGLAAEQDAEPEAVPSRAVRKLSPARQRAKAGVKAALEDAGFETVDLAPHQNRDTGGDDGYVDQDSEWEDARYGGEEHPTTKVFQDFTGGEKGISGKTDVTKPQFAFLWTLRNMQADFEERGMLDVAHEIEEGARWFETYRLSIDRKSRAESVDILRGRLDMAPKTDEQASPLRFN